MRCFLQHGGPWCYLNAITKQLWKVSRASIIFILQVKKRNLRVAVISPELQSSSLEEPELELSSYDSSSTCFPHLYSGDNNAYIVVLCEKSKYLPIKYAPNKCFFSAIIRPCYFYITWWLILITSFKTKAHFPLKIGFRIL